MRKSAPTAGIRCGESPGQETVRCVAKINKLKKGIDMKISQFKDYSELPLFLNAELVAKLLGVSPSSGYELMHEPDFPVLKIGSRMVVPKEKFIQWVERNTVGGPRP